MPSFRAVVTKDWLWHEGHGLAIGIGNLVDDILVDLYVVGSLDHRRKLDAEFVLGRGHFMVVLFNDHAHVGHGSEHFATDVLGAIERRHGEVALLETDMVTGVTGLIGGVVVGRQFRMVNFKTHLVGGVGVPHVVEHEEFWLCAEHYGIANAGSLEVFLGLLGSGAWVAAVGLVGQRLENVAVDDHGGRAKEGVHVSR